MQVGGQHVAACYLKQLVAHFKPCVSTSARSCWQWCQRRSWHLRTMASPLLHMLLFCFSFAQVVTGFTALG